MNYACRLGFGNGENNEKTTMMSTTLIIVVSNVATEEKMLGHPGFGNTCNEKKPGLQATTCCHGSKAWTMKKNHNVIMVLKGPTKKTRWEVALVVLVLEVDEMKKKWGR